jgi:hypothetical protein
MKKEEIIALFTDDVKTRRDIIREYIKNESNSFEDRLEVWSKTPKHLYTEESYIIHLDEYDTKYGDITWFDEPFWCEKYETVDLPECYARLLENDFDTSESDQEAKERAELFAKGCMERGLHSFQLDW